VRLLEGDFYLGEASWYGGIPCFRELGYMRQDESTAARAEHDDGNLPPLENLLLAQVLVGRYQNFESCGFGFA